jgi:hypothetical protein
MSRLARSGREWHQLLELCALSGTLLGDPDGIYDPADHNDRLLLGLKGTISEAELHLIKQRMWPAGFVRRPSGEVALDPDEQARAVIRLVFGLFDRLGTVNACCVSWLTTTSSLGCGCGKGPGAGSCRGAGPAGPGCRTFSATRLTLGFTPMAAAGLIPGGGRWGGRSPGGCAPHARTGLSSSPGCCPPISASSSTRRTCGDWTPTGPGPRAWARCVTARPCWPGWWPAAAAARR